MQPKQLVVRCFAESRHGVWQAFCIDLNLAVQGESQREVIDKLGDMIVDYLIDALEGEDEKFAEQLLDRPAPLSLRLRYHWYAFIQRCTRLHSDLHGAFQKALPLTISRHNGPAHQV
ncbi:hypothetical protein [Thioalkalivibrio thiocyanodenitrificans]|uniref:hypothetical protein n=1 Tax=Thioalkalivibrio thiocyanodenitrificans TaxID=243063 RepID=UPI0009FB952E|nr:hypothetical protein [Thioalkalivibrio thiocyanodenitrificans]